MKVSNEGFDHGVIERLPVTINCVTVFDEKVQWINCVARLQYKFLAMFSR
jgi:hypothetical protein